MIQIDAITSVAQERDGLILVVESGGKYIKYRHRHPSAKVGDQFLVEDYDMLKEGCDQYGRDLHKRDRK